MRTFMLVLLYVLSLTMFTCAQEARFFRVTGPVATTITAFTADGYMTWTNTPTNATFTVQTTSSLLSGTSWVDYIQLPVTTPLTTRRLFDPNPPSGMALIPAGTFTMGDCLDGLFDAAPTNVSVSAFYMDVNLVSSNQWWTVYSYATNHGYRFFTNNDNGVYQAGGKAWNHPVQTVNWWDTVKWCNARSEQAGLTPVYYTDAGLTQIYTNGEPETLHPKWAANGYRLPTEAEWEKAARGGLSGQRFPWGNTVAESQANYLGNTAIFSYDLGSDGYNPIGNYPTTSPGTSPVGSFLANGYGLYDMAGNVFEWCWDWYATPYAGGSNPRGPVGPLSYRVVRGGGWDDVAYFVRCASRVNVSPKDGGWDLGFRCVRGL